MKFMSILLCCTILTFENSLGQNTNLMQDFIGRLHDAGEKVKEDIHTFSEKIKSDFQKIVQPNLEKRNNNVKLDNHEGLIFVTSSTVRPTTAENRAEDRMIFPTEEPEAIPMPAKPMTPEVTIPKTTTGNSTNGEGKENFAGGCLEGFKRTSDGRCMEVY